MYKLYYIMKTYRINRSNILKRYLNDNNYEENKSGEKVDFSYWDIVDAKGVSVEASKSVFPRKLTNRIDNKLSMYKKFIENNISSFLPPTYTNLDNLDVDLFDHNKIFFLKEVGGSGNKDVHVIKTKLEIDTIINRKKGVYILQEEVPNMYLHNGSKVVIRAYGLITTNKYNNYLYIDAKADVYIKKYDKNVTSNDIHNDEYHSVKHCILSEMPFYDVVFKRMKEICKTIDIFFDEEMKNTSENYFIINGYDFILDNDLNPYLIEINTYPNFSESVDQPVKNKLLVDFANLFILKNNIPHNWIDVNEEVKPKLYILGGFGTMAGLDITKKVIETYKSLVKVENDSDHIQFVLDNECNDKWNITYDGCLDELKNNMENIINYNIINKKYIILGIGCNTKHACLKEFNILYKNIKITNMISCVSEKVKEVALDKNIYLWSTIVTFNSNIYQDELIQYNLKLEDNNQEMQELVEKLILNIKRDDRTIDCLDMYKNLIDMLPNDCIVILGCTELPILLNELEKYATDRNIIFIDCNLELARGLCKDYLNILTYK